MVPSVRQWQAAPVALGRELLRLGLHVRRRLDVVAGAEVTAVEPSPCSSRICREIFIDRNFNRAAMGRSAGPADAVRPRLVVRT
ncbi:hypothetical protein C2142_19025 [Streptomyces sp. CB01881]|nr:hypothetical protein C2142_19025 [Streptomyces sp. CB01881]